MSAAFKVQGLKFALGEYSSILDKAISKAKADKLVSRIWDHDHTLWKPQPKRISDRLGWLNIAERMEAEIPTLTAFADEVKKDGVRNALLLGMGGSSLAPELFAKMFGSKRGLALEVLDSTDPKAIAAKAKSHPINQTLFIVSSKSGSTVETNSFFKYFYTKATDELGANKASQQFIAITDPGSGLAKMATALSFRYFFLADPNIGGRYSALSQFGLVPAALAGVDLQNLLASARQMAERCQEETAEKNPGALLGLALGVLAVAGRDKATFLLPPDRAGFGDWAEQLIAESTGKEGRGILPVVGEPQLSADEYGNDRVFINLGTGNLAAAEPALQIDWQDDYELGGQFFLWEFATAVAGYVMGINPFDQPNVESTKIQARKIVEEFQKSGKLPSGKSEPLNAASLHKFLQQAGDGDYVALQAYAAPTEQLTAALQSLRGQLAQQYRIATTLGYGPRFLHSTGQLHKGDGGKGLFIQFVPKTREDIAIPTEAGSAESEISFGVLKAAQALGDAEALRAAGRRVISFEVEGDLSEALVSADQRIREA